jgi:gliding motility-associated-like protein
MKKFFLLFSCILLSHFMMMAQAPFISTNISNNNPQVGETITVDVLTNNFTNLIGIEFEIKWDPNLFDYVSRSNLITNNTLPGFQGSDNPTNTSNVADVPGNTNRGIVKVLWTETNFNPISLPAQTRLLTITLRAKANGRGKIEITNGLYITDDEFRMQPDSKDVTVGSGVSTNNDPVNVTIGNVTGRVGQEIRVPITVSNFVDIESIQFGFRYNPALLQFVRIDALNLQDLTLGSFGTPDNPNVDAGEITMAWSNMSSSATTVPNGTKIFELVFNIISGNQPSTIISIAGDRIALEARRANVGAVPITPVNATVTIQPNDNPTGPLTITAGSANGQIGQQVCIPFTVQNFTNLESLQFGITYNTTILQFNSIRNFNLEGLSATNFGTPPAVAAGRIIFSWSNSVGGASSVPNNTAIFEVCFNAIAPGTATVGYGGSNTEAIRNNTPIQVTTNPGMITVQGSGISDEFSLNLPTLTTPPNSRICLNVSVAGFRNIVGLQYSIRWNPAVLRFSGLEGFNPSLNELGMSNFGTTATNMGRLSMSWNDSRGVNLNDGTVIYQICFDAIGTSGQNSTVEFTGQPLGIEIINASEELVPFKQTAGRVNIFGTPLPTACDQNALPVCASRETVSVGEEVCTRITAQNFNRIISAQFAIKFDTDILTYKEIRLGNNPLNLSLDGNLGVFANDGLVSFRWDDATLAGVTIANDAELFRICYTAKEVGTSLISYQDPPTSTIEVINSSFNELNFRGGEGSVTVREACAPLTVNGNVTNISCRGGNNGQIAVTVQGGDGNYTYAWSQNSISGANPRNLSAGNYTVTVTNAACQFNQTRSFTITEPAGITISANVSGRVTCFGDNGASITVTAGGGTGNLTYRWDNAALTGANPTNVPAGMYTVTVTDANNCSIELDSITVEGPRQALQVTTNKTDIQCAGEATGAVDLTVQGGTPDYTIRWMDNDTLRMFRRSQLAAGTYAVTITDGNNCNTSASVVIASTGDPLRITQSTIRKIETDNPGSVTITVAGGQANYIYNWTGPQGFAGATTKDVNNLTLPGEYAVTITDQRGCTTTQTFRVPLPLGLAQPNIKFACGTAEDGAIALDIIGGFTPFTYIWSNGQTSPELSNLRPGNFSVTITDGEGESISATYTIPNAPAIVITQNITNETCSAISNNGAINLQLTGGLGRLTLNWVNDSLPAGVTNLSNLSSGRYAFVVRDSVGCEVRDAATIQFQPSLPQPANYQIIPATCAGFTDGLISFNIPCGDPGFQVMLIGVADTVMLSAETYNPRFEFNNLAPGTYRLMIRDGNGNTFPDEITIAAPQIFNVVPTRFSSTAILAPCNGRINLAVSGGGGNYTYRWSNNQTTKDIGSVCPGTYTVTITDVAGCTQVDTFQIQHLNASGIVTNAQCPEDDFTGSIMLTVESGQPSYTYEWRNEAGDLISTNKDLINAKAGKVSVKVTESSGVSITRSFDIESNSRLEVVPSFGANYNGFGVSCNGAKDAMLRAMGRNGENFTYRWLSSTNEELSTSNLLSGVGVGTYRAVVTDGQECRASSTIIVTEPPRLDLVLDVVNIPCAGDGNGEVLAAPSGGASMNYRFSWSFDSTLNISAVSDLKPGAYQVSVRDDNNCVIAKSFEITEPEPLKASFDILPFTEQQSGGAEATPKGGTPDYTYQWIDLTTITNPVQTTKNISNVAQETNYQLIVTDIQGCKDTALLQVFSRNLCLSNRAIITPNGDNRNETLAIKCLNIFEQKRLEVYTRWGDLVFVVEDYDGLWSGTDMNGNLLPDGAYFFVLHYLDGNTMRQERGSVTILTE